MDGSCLHDVVVCLESVVLSFEMIASSQLNIFDERVALGVFIVVILRR